MNHHRRTLPRRRHVLVLFNTATRRTDLLLVNEAGIVALVDSVEAEDAQAAIDAVRRDHPHLPVEVLHGAIRRTTTNTTSEDQA